MNKGLKGAGFAIFILLFLLAAILTAVLPESSRKAENAIALPDGRLLRLEAVTFGTSHEYRTGPEWLEKLQKMSPGWLRDKLGPEVRSLRHSRREERVQPWISVTLSPGIAPDWDYLHVVSDSGETFAVGTRSYPGSFADRRFMLPDLAVMPRRDASCLFTGLVNRLPFAMRIENPAAGRAFPEWKTEPMPITKQVNGFDFELAEAELSRTATREHFSMRFRAHENGSFLKDWFNYSWRLTDATGNEGSMLPTNEPAWRVSVSISRRFAARWATNEYRDFPFTNMPGPAEVLEFDVAANLGGTSLGRVWIGGPGDYKFENGLITEKKLLSPDGGNAWTSGGHGTGDRLLSFSQQEYWIHLERHGADADHTCAVFLIDVSGKEVPVHRVRSSSTYHHFRIRAGDVPPSGPITLRVAGDRYLRAEFTLDPAQIKRVERRPNIAR